MSKCEKRIELDTAMKEAMRAKEKARLDTIRLILADIKRIEVDERKDLNDTEVIQVMDKMLKQRRDSIEQFRAAGRNELAEKEEAEMAIIQTFLPEPLSDAEIDALISEAIANTGAESMKDMGKVMGQLKPQLQGKADMGAVSKRIKSQLS